jgi:hypothetical protein
VAAGLRAGGAVPVERPSAPGRLQGVDLSDHLNSWAHGFPAVMVTDTAFMRSGRYHTKEDRPETLDYRRMAEVVRVTRCAVEAVARREPAGPPRRKGRWAAEAE